jgi:hypothetical protein
MNEDDILLKHEHGWVVFSTAMKEPSTPRPGHTDGPTKRESMFGTSRRALSTSSEPRKAVRSVLVRLKHLEMENGTRSSGRARR